MGSHRSGWPEPGLLSAELCPRPRPSLYRRAFHDLRRHDLERLGEGILGRPVRESRLVLVLRPEWPREYRGVRAGLGEADASTFVVLPFARTAPGAPHRDRVEWGGPAELRPRRRGPRGDGKRRRHEHGRPGPDGPHGRDARPARLSKGAGPERSVRG